MRLYLNKLSGLTARPLYKWEAQQFDDLAAHRRPFWVWSPAETRSVHLQSLWPFWTFEPCANFYEQNRKSGCTRLGLDR